MSPRVRAVTIQCPLLFLLLLQLGLNVVDLPVAVTLVLRLQLGNIAEERLTTLIDDVVHGRVVALEACLLVVLIDEQNLVLRWEGGPGLVQLRPFGRLPHSLHHVLLSILQYTVGFVNLYI